MMAKYRKQESFCQVYGYCTKPACIIMKRYVFGDLSNYIRGKSEATFQFPYTKVRLINIFRRCCVVIGIMHRDGFAHCDVKPSNFLLDIQEGQLVPVAADFGISRVLSDDLQVKAFEKSELNGASISYAAPEVLARFHSPNEATPANIILAGDVYALAVSLREMLLRRAQWT